MDSVSIYKVLEGPIALEDVSDEFYGYKDHMIVVMATTEGQEGWFEYELICPDFDSAYALETKIKYSMEPIEVSFGGDLE